MRKSLPRTGSRSLRTFGPSAAGGGAARAFASRSPPHETAANSRQRAALPRRSRNRGSKKDGCRKIVDFSAPVRSRGGFGRNVPRSFRTGAVPSQRPHSPSRGTSVRAATYRRTSDSRASRTTYQSFGPAATRLLPSSLPVNFTKFLMKRSARSLAFASHSEAFL